MKKKRIKIILISLLAIAVIALGIGAYLTFADTAPDPEELLSNLPDIDLEKYNKFDLELTVQAIDAASSSTKTEKFSMEGTLEVEGNVSHMYGLNITAPSGTYENTETWTDLSTGQRYTDLGEGFTLDTISNFNVISDLENAINNKGKVTFTDTDTAYTMSWEFPTDNEYLFTSIITDADRLTGNGTITAVFDKESLEFQYFTIVISASNPDTFAGGIIEAALNWETVNGSATALEIPSEISDTLYTESTGVISDGYDEIVNPMAEEFIKSYGGTAEVSVHNNGAYMFWTSEENGTSATVNYMKTLDPASTYNKSYDFLSSLYASPAEETLDESYFYSQSSGELTYIAYGSNYYAEIIITAAPDTEQGTLRKSLITYKAKLEAY